MRLDLHNILFILSLQIGIYLQQVCMIIILFSLQHVCLASLLKYLYTIANSVILVLVTVGEY